MNKEQFFNELVKKYGNCPLMDGREKGCLDDLTEMTVTIDDYAKLSDFHCVTFEEFPEAYFFSNAATEKMLSDYPDGELKGLQIRFEDTVKTKDKKTFRPVTLIGFKEE